MPGSGEGVLEADFVKRVFAVSPLDIRTYLNINNPNVPKHANIEISLVQNPVFEGDAGFTGNVAINGILNCPSPFQYDFNEVKVPGLYHYEAVTGALNTPFFSRNWRSIEIGNSENIQKL